MILSDNLNELVQKHGCIIKICQTCGGRYLVDTKDYVNGWYNHFHCSSCCYSKIRERQHEEYMRQLDGGY